MNKETDKKTHDAIFRAAVSRTDLANLTDVNEQLLNDQKSNIKA